MKKQSVLLLVIVAALFGGPAISLISAQTAESDALEADLFRALFDDIEIMKRVIDKTLQAHFKQKTDSQSAALFHPGIKWSKAADGADEVDVTFESDAGGRYRYLPGLNTVFGNDFDGQGFYVPGSGAIFRFEVAVAAHETPKKDEADVTSADLWKEAELEYLRREHAIAYNLLMQEKQQNKNWVPDPAALEEVIDLLVDTIGRHGHNIDGLGKNDRITLLLGVKARIPRAQLLLPPDDPAAIALSYYGAAQTKTVGGDEVIIQIPMAYIALYQETKDRAAFKKAATILRYPAKGHRPKPDRIEAIGYGR